MNNEGDSLPSQDQPASTTAPQPAAAVLPLDAQRVRPYVPRTFQQHLVDAPESKAWTDNGTAVFVDISGFTQLSEQLARKGREGAEQITDVISHSFEEVLAVAYRNAGGLIKFGGDALLLWFHDEGHAERASRAAVLMRSVLDDVGRIDLPGAQVTLRMSQGVHSGEFHFFSVGTSHFELLPVGPGWSKLASLEHEAQAGEILISDETASQLAAACRGEAKGPGFLLKEAPPGETSELKLRDPPAVSPEMLARCLSPAIRAHVLSGGSMPEHRPVTVAFIRFEGTDALIAERGAEATAKALHRVMTAVETATEEQGVTFLASDVDANGGKLILTSGAPKVSGNDEERMLLALTKIVASDLPIPLRIGVHRGAVFAGDIGPKYRRTYTVMGDAVNLTARLMAKAEPRQIYATGDVLDRSATHFETTKLEPFAVKGKAEPVQAWSVGRAQSSKSRQVSTQRLPLTGRNAELGAIRKAFTSARGGAGRMIEVIGDSGIGKTRLLEALRDAATGLNKQHATCEAYTASTPYAVWTELLREYMGYGREDPEVEIAERLKAEVEKQAPDLLPWLPLIGIPFGLEISPTPEVAMLEERHRRAKVHETVTSFLAAFMQKPQLIEIENAHHMDEASAELLTHLTGELGTRPWLFAVARQGHRGFAGPEKETVVKIDLKPLAQPDTLRLAHLATQQTPLAEHVLEVVATRSGGNPQFLRDLLQKVVDSGGGIADLPDSAEAATMAAIDSLSPEERAVVRHAAVFGLTFHPRMLGWFEGEEGFTVPSASMWHVLVGDLFDEEPDGYLRFRRSLLREAAYEGLPYKSRRRLHAIVATHLEEEAELADDIAGALSLHYFEAGDFPPAQRYATTAGKRAEAAYAYVEAAGLYGRALEAARKLPDVAKKDLAVANELVGDAWYKAGEFRKASDAFVAARPLIEDDTLMESGLMLKLSYLEEKLGKYTEALRWTDQARGLLEGAGDGRAAKQRAEVTAWHATVLQAAGRMDEALEWAERAITESEAAGAPDALGRAYFVKGWVYGETGKEGARALFQSALEAYQLSGNRPRQAVVLSDIGVECQREGLWDEALTNYEQARQAALQLGNNVFAAIARTNIAEILIDRGEWAEAETLLVDTLRFWRASEYRYFLGACLHYLGHVLLRLGRIDEAIARLEESKASFLHVGAETETPPVEARIAECLLAKGDTDAALELVRGMISRASESNGIGKVSSVLERIQAHALIKQGDLWGARDALEASLDAAKERRNFFDATLTKLSLIELDRLEGVEPPIEMVDESRSLLASLKVRAVPPVPAPPQ